MLIFQHPAKANPPSEKKRIGGFLETRTGRLAFTSRRRKALNRSLQNHESRKPMEHKISPIAASLIFAAAAALLLAAATLLPLRPISRTTATNSAIFLCLAAYAVFLVRSNGRGLRALFAPLLMLAAVLAVAGSVTGFVVPAAAGLCWIRSGICFPGSMPRRVCAEALTCPGGLALVWLLQPPGPYGGALDMWMFGLIQSLYVVAIDVERTVLQEPFTPERLEKEHCRAEALLREQKLERAFDALGL
jgi:hypothetical protein